MFLGYDCKRDMIAFFTMMKTDGKSRLRPNTTNYFPVVKVVDQYRKLKWSPTEFLDTQDAYLGENTKLNPNFKNKIKHKPLFVN